MAATASSESQGKTVALIIFVLLTIASGVTAFYFYDQVDSLTQNAAKAEEDARTARTAENELKKKYDALRLKTLGEQNAGDHDAAMTLIQQDLDNPRINDKRKQLKKNYPTFKDAIDYLHNELSTADQRETELSETIAKQQKEIDGLQSKYQVQNDEFRKDRDAKEQELKDQVAKFEAERTRLTQAQVAADERHNKVLNEKQDIEGQFESTKKRNEQKIRDLTNRIAELTEREQRSKEEQFVRAVGTITALSRANGTTTATINLGSADGLLKDTTFSVFGRDKEGNPYVMPKAGIEVVRILDQHRAEARLYGEEITDVVLPGDLLSNPVWTKGKKLGVGVLGLIYLDNDKTPDNEEFVRLVRSLGGEVDSIFDIQDLKKKGELGVDTAWLVVGEMPEDRENLDQDQKDFNKAMNIARQQFLAEAKEKGVRIINVRNFLTYMGHQQPQRTVKAGEEREFMFGKPRDPLPEKGPAPPVMKRDGAAGQ